jgi:hypothetical protein
MFRARGWLAQKNSLGAGWTDYTFISPFGFILFVEFKASETSELRPIQSAWHSEVLKRITSKTPTATVAVRTWSSMQQAYDWFSEYNQYEKRRKYNVGTAG